MTRDLDNRRYSGAGAGVFVTTRWSLVLAAGHSSAPGASAALEKLCQTYWYPLYAYVRRRGCGPHDAQDLTQGFFAHLLQRHAFRGVAPGRAKFRSFLLASLNHFLDDERDRQRAQKRGGGQPLLSFDAQQAEQRYAIEPADAETPERLFERRWAIALIDAAVARLQREYVAEAKGPLFALLRGSIVEAAEARRYAQVAIQLGMSEEAVKKAAQRLRRRYREIIHEEIAHTVATASEVDEELRYLWSVLCE